MPPWEPGLGHLGRSSPTGALAAGDRVSRHGGAQRPAPEKRGAAVADIRGLGRRAFPRQASSYAP